MGGVMKSLEPAMGMLLIQIFNTVMQLLTKVILNRGTFIFALMTYRHIVATVCVAPLVFYFERDHVIAKKLNRQVFFWLFMSALTGITSAMGLCYYGLHDTSATYATNFLNLVPIVTFIFSIILRMEKLGVKSRAGKVKMLGVILCVGGALITSLYKGKGFHIGHHVNNLTMINKSNRAHWLRGTLLLVVSCFSYGIWFIVQVKLLKVFSSKYWAIMLTCIMASMQSTVIGLCLNRKKAAWKLGWDLQLLTIIYSGSLVTTITFCLTTWAISIRGPTYPPMFNPLTLIFVAISEAIILGEEIRVGNIVGSVVIIVGLYCFLWGKKKEIKKLSPQAHLPIAAVVEAAAPTTSETESGILQSANDNANVVEGSSRNH